jgi:hypothetical protein
MHFSCESSQCVVRSYEDLRNLIDYQVSRTGLVLAHFVLQVLYMENSSFNILGSLE